MMLKIATLNIRGIQSNKTSIKIEKLLLLQKTHHFDILFLQETHLTNIEYATYITKNWKGKWFWSFCEHLSKGVGIFISGNLKYKLDQFTYDSQGRVACIYITCQNVKYRLLNIYAPNNPTERKDFIANLEDYLSINRTFIIGGDWNFVENPSLDRNVTPSVGNIGNQEMLKLKSDYNLFQNFQIPPP